MATAEISTATKATLPPRPHHANPISPSAHQYINNSSIMAMAEISTNTKATDSATKATSRKSASLPKETVDYLKAWMMSTKHISNPYPNKHNKHEKAEIMAKTGIEPKQLANWFVNNRKRYWKPRVEAKLQPAMAPSRLPQETVDYLKAWMMSTKHINYPYPSEQEKAEIMAKTGIEPKQLTNWFVNNRKRYLKQREQQPTTNGASNPAPAQKTNTTQQLVSAAKPSKGPTAPLAKKMLVLPAMPVTSAAKSAPTSVASASVPSLKPAAPTIQPAKTSSPPASLKMHPSRCELKVEDARLYLDQVKLELGDRICNEFIEIMKCFKAQEVNIVGVIKCVRTLFCGYNNLILGFNTFLPDGYKIEMRDMEPVFVGPGLGIHGLPASGIQGKKREGALENNGLGRLPDTNSASNPAPAKKTNSAQQLVTAAPSVAKPWKGPTAPRAKKMSDLPAMPVAAVAKSTPTSIASASVPSSRKSERLLGKGKKREGASKYNAIEIKDSSSSSSDDESVDSDSTEEVGEERLGHNPELPKYNASLEKANAAEVVHESIGMKTHSGKNRGRKVLTDAENKLLLVR
eukprot:scaffold126_cov114-Alexandrium_tamarense.AAC.2